MNVLVASDEQVIRIAASKALISAGYDVKSVADGQLAWDYIDQQTGQLIALLDWQLPIYDGLSIAKKLRTITSPNFNYIYIILLTKQRAKIDELVALESGIDDYIHKPFLPDELIARVNIGNRLLSHERKLTSIITQFRNIIDNSAFPIVGLDRMGHIRRMNLPFSKLASNRHISELVGLSVGDLLSIDKAEYQVLIRQIQEQRNIDFMPIRAVWNSPVTPPTHIYGKAINDIDEVAYTLTFVNGLQSSHSTLMKSVRDLGTIALS